MDVRVGSTVIGDGHLTFVVAEMAWSHDGSVDKAKVIVRGAARARANAINLHLTSMPDYMVPSYGSGPGRVSAGKETRPVFDYLQSINLPQADWVELVEYSRSLDLAVSTLCNDHASLEFAASRLNPDIYMIHPSAIGEEAFVRAVARQGKPTVLYLGGCWMGEAERAILWARGEGNQQLILQHGFQGYPTRPPEMNLRFIPTLKGMFGFPVAFGDHTEGGSELALIAPLLAVAAGANVIEKHITHDRAAKGEDFEAALNPAEFATLVQYLRQTEEALGSSTWRPLSQRGLDYRSVVRKRAVAARAIAKGARIGPSDVVFKRADAGVFPEELPILIGRRTIAELEESTPITWDDVA